MIELKELKLPVGNDMMHGGCGGQGPSFYAASAILEFQIIFYRGDAEAQSKNRSFLRVSASLR